MFLGDNLYILLYKMSIAKTTELVKCFWDMVGRKQKFTVLRELRDLSSVASDTDNAKINVKIFFKFEMCNQIMNNKVVECSGKFRWYEVFAPDEMHKASQFV
jgi:hypothetical protein